MSSLNARVILKNAASSSTSQGEAAPRATASRVSKLLRSVQDASTHMYIAPERYHQKRQWTSDTGTCAELLPCLVLTSATKIMVAVETHELTDVSDQDAKLRMEWQTHSVASDVKGEIVAV